MATVYEIIQGINQAAANAYDGSDAKVVLDREQGELILDRRGIDGFKVRIIGPILRITYQAEARLKDVKDKGFEDSVVSKLKDIVKFLKKEYKKVTKSSVTLTEVTDADVIVQSTSKVKSWVQATKQYKIGGLDGVEPVRRSSERDQDKPFEKRFKDFLELSSDKRPSNDKAPKNPDTPEA